MVVKRRNKSSQKKTKENSSPPASPQQQTSFASFTPSLSAQQQQHQHQHHQHQQPISTQGRVAFPKVDSFHRKQKAIQELSDDILENTRIPSKEEVIRDLENSDIPTRGGFYSFSELLDRNNLTRKYPEFNVLRSGDGRLPDEINVGGEYSLDPSINIQNTKHYINPLLFKAKDEGFCGAKVLETGIRFYIQENELKPKALKFYRRFFLTTDEFMQQVAGVINNMIHQTRTPNGNAPDLLQIKIRGSPFNHLKLTYPDNFVRPRAGKKYELISQIKSDLRRHYLTMDGVTDVNLYHDQNLSRVVIRDTSYTEPTVLKIYFNLKTILPILTQMGLLNI